MPLPACPARFEVEIVDAPDALRSPLRAGRVPALAGETLLKALQRAQAPVLSICGGQAADPVRLHLHPTGAAGGLPAAGKVEAGLLEFLDDPGPGHRLACQLLLGPALDGLGLTLAP